MSVMNEQTSQLAAIEQDHTYAGYTWEPAAPSYESLHALEMANHFLPVLLDPRSSIEGAEGYADMMQYIKGKSGPVDVKVGCGYDGDHNPKYYTIHYAIPNASPAPKSVIAVFTPDGDVPIGVMLATGASKTSYIVLPDYPTDGNSATKLMDIAGFPPRKGTTMEGRPPNPTLNVFNNDGQSTTFKYIWNLSLEHGAVKRPAIFKKIN